MEPFTEISIDRLMNIKYLNDIPWISKVFEKDLKWYCPLDDVENGIIALNENNNIFKLLILINKDKIGKLEDALVKTSIIKWNGRLGLLNEDDDTVELLKRCYMKLGYQNVVVDSAVKLYLNEDTELFDLKQPQDTYTASLSLKHLQQVSESWPYSTEHKDPMNGFENLISGETSFGIFSLDHHLLAWAFISDRGILRHVYCEEEHRRKGLAQYIVKYVANIRLAKGKGVYCFVDENNVNSLKLFHKLNFKTIGIGVWISTKNFK